MATANLLDIAKLNGNDAVVGLIEEVMTSAPEVMALPARTIRGTSYRAVSRESLPGVGFRSANEGSTPSKSGFANKITECFILSGIINVDKAVALAYEDGPDAWKAIESAGVVRQTLIELGQQIIEGTTVDAKGFQGLHEIHTALNNGLLVDAGGTTASTGSSVYGISRGVQGVSLIFGGGNALSLGEWQEQQLLDGNNKPYQGYVNGITGWVGMQVGSKYAVGRLRDCTADSGKGVTDAKLAELLSKYPVGYKPDLWLMSRRSAFQLQSSRSATSNTSGKAATGAEAFAPQPTESNGIPILVTDSITDTEALS